MDNLGSTYYTRISPELYHISKMINEPCSIAVNLERTALLLTFRYPSERQI